MLIPRALVVPTMPTLLVDEHRGHRTPMLEALAVQAERLRAEEPDVVVALSPRWISEGPFLVGANKRNTTLTDYPGLGVEVRYDCPGHPTLARDLVTAGVAAGVRVAEALRGVDSGITVPLHFLLPASRVPVVPLSLADRPAAECRAWGAVLRRVLSGRPERIALVIGGMLSDNEHAVALRRDVPATRDFDERVLEALRTGAWQEVGARSAAETDLVQPQAGLRHLQILRGVLGRDEPGLVLGYESGPGFGAALLEFPLDTVETPAPGEDV